jgi:hypothetical protein
MVSPGVQAPALSMPPWPMGTGLPSQPLFMGDHC